MMMTLIKKPQTNWNEAHKTIRMESFRSKRQLAQRSMLEFLTQLFVSHFFFFFSVELKLMAAFTLLMNEEFVSVGFSLIYTISSTAAIKQPEDVCRICDSRHEIWAPAKSHGNPRDGGRV